VVGTGDDLEQARAQAYAGIGMIELAGSLYRTDIAESACALSPSTSSGQALSKGAT
jgi:phosphoribosylamine-glycine ligase